MQHSKKRVLVLTLVLLASAFLASSYTELLITGQQVLLQAEDVEQRSTAFLDEDIILFPSFETAIRRNDPSVFATTEPVASNLAGGVQGGNPLSNDTNITNITATPVPPVTLLGPKNIHLLYLMEDINTLEANVIHLILNRDGNIFSKEKTYNVSFLDFFLGDLSMDFDSKNRGHIAVVRYGLKSSTNVVIYQNINPLSNEEIVPFPYSNGGDGFLPYFVDVRTDSTDTPFIVAFGVFYEGGSIKDSRIYLTKKTPAGWWQTPKNMIITDTGSFRYPPRPSFHFDGNSRGRIVYGTIRDIGMPPEHRWTFYELVFESSGLVLAHRKINSGPIYTADSEIHDIKTTVDLSTNSYLGYVHSVERLELPPTSSSDEVYFSSSLNNWLPKTLKTLRREPFTEPPASLDIILEDHVNSAVPILYLPVTLRDSQATLSRLLLFSSVDGGGLWTETPLTSSQNYFANVNVLRANQRMYITYLERDKNRGSIVDFMKLQLTWFDGKMWTTKLLEQMAEGSRIRSQLIHVET